MSILTSVGLEETPVWMVYNSPDTGPVPVLVGWYTYTDFEAERFMTHRTFGTESEALAWLEEFWHAFWVWSR